MDQAIIELVVAILVAVIGYIIGVAKQKNVELKAEDLYVKYGMIFNVSGAVIKTLDEKLYNEMNEALTKMKRAYESPEFTTDMFLEIVDESKDVFNRAQELLKG